MREYLEELKSILDRVDLAETEKICDVLYEAYQAERTVFVFGNGGSAALASHLVCDLGKGLLPAELASRKGVKRLKILSLTDNVPLITAWANDTCYENIFAEQMASFLASGDVVFAISGTGNSPNVLKALECARQAGATTVGITGYEGGKMKTLLAVSVVVPSHCMQQIEDTHLILAHLIFLELRRRLSKEFAR